MIEMQTHIPTSVDGGETTRHALPSRLLHDLRTPLNHIIGYSDLLVEKAQEEGQDAFVPDMKKVRAAGGQLLTLIDENFSAIQFPESATANDVPYTAVVFASGEAVSTGSPIATTKANLLVVDDDVDNRDVLERRLKRQGYAVALAENGRLALDMMRESTFDLILLDVQMPEMDGFEVLKQLKSDDRLQHIPVIMISAMSEMDTAVTCIEMGAEDYLPKPFDPTLLQARTLACLERKRLHDREERFTTELQESCRRVQELEQTRDNLSKLIVHDLRAPLESVIFALQTLEAMDDLSVTQREVVDISLAGGQTMLDMINEPLGTHQD